MELKREHTIQADQSSVWRALNDDDVLKACIPGCESIERTGENVLRAVVKIKVGPIGARFSGVVTLSDIDAPNGYRLTFEGQGGAAGFAKGEARVDLKAESDEVTILAYETRAQVGGKLAQIGSRLIESVAVKISGEFFEAFLKLVEKERVSDAAGQRSAS